MQVIVTKKEQYSKMDVCTCTQGEEYPFPCPDCYCVRVQQLPCGDYLHGFQQRTRKQTCNICWVQELSEEVAWHLAVTSQIKGTSRHQIAEKKLSEFKQSSSVGGIQLYCTSRLFYNPVLFFCLSGGHEEQQLSRNWSLDSSILETLKTTSCCIFVQQYIITSELDSQQLSMRSSNSPGTWFSPGVVCPSSIS